LFVVRLFRRFFQLQGIGGVEMEKTRKHKLYNRWFFLTTFVAVFIGGLFFDHNNTGNAELGFLPSLLGLYPMVESVQLTETFILNFAQPISRGLDIVILPLWVGLTIMLLTQKRLDEDETENFDQFYIGLFGSIMIFLVINGVILLSLKLDASSKDYYQIHFGLISVMPVTVFLFALVMGVILLPIVGVLMGLLVKDINITTKDVVWGLKLNNTAYGFFLVWAIYFSILNGLVLGLIFCLLAALITQYTFMLICLTGMLLGRIVRFILWPVWLLLRRALELMKWKRVIQKLSPGCRWLSATD
jgi:hypothetical protein